jgi:hypothetical protein
VLPYSESRAGVLTLLYLVIVPVGDIICCCLLQTYLSPFRTKVQGRYPIVISVVGAVTLRQKLEIFPDATD